MKIISHRGLLDGPNKNLENRPLKILEAIENGYDCEVDIRCENSKVYFGHDSAKYLVDDYFIKSIRDNCFFHCKDISSILFSIQAGLNAFIHKDELATFTSMGEVWTANKTVVTSLNGMAIYVNPDQKNIPDFGLSFLYGICTDYPNEIKNDFNKKGGNIRANR